MGYGHVPTHFVFFKSLKAEKLPKALGRLPYKPMPFCTSYYWYIKQIFFYLMVGRPQKG